MASLVRISKNLAGFSRLNLVKYSSVTAKKVYISNTYVTKGFSTSYLVRALESVAPPPPPSLPPTQVSSLHRSLETLDGFAKSYGRVNRRYIDRIFDEMVSGQSVTSAEVLLIIPCCGQLMADEIPESRTELVKNFWSKFEELGIDLNLYHYNALLRVYNENGYNFSPKDFMAMLKTKGIEPNRITYVRLMHHYCRLGDIEGATGILQLMKNEQLPINETVFNTLLMGHCQAGDMQSAQSTLDLMQQSSVDPSNETYKALVCGYAKSGDMKSVTGILKDCKDQRIVLRNSDYLEIIYTLATNGWTEHIDTMIELSKKSMGYNQDCVILILRLVNANLPDVAFKMLNTMVVPVNPSGQAVDTGSFFIRQLVKTKQDAGKVIEICRTLEEKGLNAQALLLAATTSLKYGADHGDLTLKLLDALKNKEVNLSGYHFWTLLASYCKLGDKKGVHEVIKHMTQSFHIRLLAATLRDRVLPFLPKETFSDEMIDIIVKAKNSPSTAAFAVLCYRLSQNNIAEAASIAAAHNVSYVVAIMRRPLTAAYLQSKDTDSYLTILTNTVDHTYNNKVTLQETPGTIIGKFVVELFEQVQSEQDDTKAQILKTVFQGLLDKSLAINEETSRFVKKTLGDKITEEMSALVDQITAMEVAVDRTSDKGTPDSIPALEKRSLALNNSRAAKYVQSQLLRLHCKNHDLARAEALKEELEKVSPLGLGSHLALLGLFIHHGLMDNAWNTYQRIMQQSPKFTLKGYNVLRLATLLAKTGRNADCIQLIYAHKEEKSHTSVADKSELLEGLSRECNSLLHVVAETGSAEELKNVYNALLANNYIQHPAFSLGPFVKVHVKCNDFPAAIAEFKRCCFEFRATPYKDELSKTLIMNENLDMLQEVTDLSSKIHGEDNTIFDLLFSFVECGKMGHVIKLLETAGITNRPNRVIAGCKRLLKKGMFNELETLLEETKQYNHILGRPLIYEMLINFYANTKNHQRGAELKAHMGGEFDTKTEATLPKAGTVTALLVRQLARDNARKNSQSAKPKQSNIQMYNLANTYCSETLEGKIIPTHQELKFVCKQLAEVGEVEKIQEMKEFVPDKIGKSVWWERYLCTANVVAGKGEDVLSKLEHQINEAKADDVDALKQSYPINASALILKEKPELLQRFEDMARSYAVRDIIHPINDLWAHLFISGHESKAGEIWSEFLEQRQLVVLTHVLRTASTTKDVKLARRLVNQLKSSDKKETLPGAAYNCLIGIYVANEQCDEAVEALDEAMKNGFNIHVKPGVLNDLVQLYKNEEKPIPPCVLTTMESKALKQGKKPPADEKPKEDSAPIDN